MSQIHPYEVSVEWTGSREGQGSVTAVASGTRNALRVPVEFGGSAGEGTNPEELLACSVAACYTITFGIIAANRKLPVLDIKTSARGEVEQAGMQFVYQSITIRPTITLAADATDEQMKVADDMAHKADMYCIITNAVRDKVSIVVEPTIVRA